MRILCTVFFFVFLFYGNDIFTQSSTDPVFHELAIWLEKNPRPDAQKLLDYTNEKIKTLQHIDVTYDFLYTILEHYPPNVIHYRFYVLFAKIATLKYDFSTASLLFYSAFEKTKEAKYLLQASIQEYQSGNINLAKRNISIIEEDYQEQNIKIPLLILKAQILIQEQEHREAFEQLYREFKNSSQKKLSSEFYYMLYRVATREHEQDVAKKNKEKLSLYYPNSIELNLIEKKHIQTLPLPSNIFAFTDEETAVDYDAFAQTEAKEPAGSYGTSISKAPQFGFQISAFQNISRARNFLLVFKEKFATLNNSIADPVLSKSSVGDHIFYQIIVPLDEKKNIEKQIIQLREEGIEGFLRENN